MIEQVTEDELAAQLMEIARDPALRNAIYERIGEYCHQCRNRLNSLKLSLYLARQQAPDGLPNPWSGLNGHYEELERKVEQVQRLCRPFALARVRIDLELLIEDRRMAWSNLWAVRHDSIQFVPPPEPVVATLDVDRVGHALDALVAWRAEQGGSGEVATLRWWQEADLVCLSWEEDSPDRAIRSATTVTPDAMWSLPWMARVISEHGGLIKVHDEGPWRLDLRWPTTPGAC